MWWRFYKGARIPDRAKWSQGFANGALVLEPATGPKHQETETGGFEGAKERPPKKRRGEVRGTDVRRRERTKGIGCIKLQDPLPMTFQNKSLKIERWDIRWGRESWGCGLYPS